MLKALGYVTLSIVLGAVLLYTGILAFGLAWQTWDRAGTFYPSPENETAFLRTYNPLAAIEPFKDADEGSNWGGGNGGSAGKQFVIHDQDYRYGFVMRVSEWPGLMANVRNDLTAALLKSGARILDSGGTADTSFHLEYEAGQSRGNVIIQPAKNTVIRGYSLPNGMKDVGLRIEIKEKWFPKIKGWDQALAAER